MEKYAIYLRKSRADIEAERDSDMDSLARHKMILTDLAARKGYYIEKIYQEIVSGETIEARPEIQKLINDCYAGKYKGILVVDITRLSRGNQGDAQVILDCLKYSNSNRGVLVITPTKVYDIAHNSDDEEYMEFELFMSRREYKMIRKRMERGKMQSIVEGNYLATHRPYGYNIVKTKTSRTLVPKEDEVPVVRQIFDWTVKDKMNAPSIARLLTSMGVPTYTGIPEWNPETIKSILINPVYIGKIRWNDRVTVKRLVDGELSTSRPRAARSDSYLEIEGKHLKYAIIDEETFAAAQQPIVSDKTRVEYKLINPLAGLLYCKNCNKAMHYKSYSTKRNRYAHKPSQLCKVKSAGADDVINAVIHGLKMYIEDFEMKLDSIPDVDENTIASQLEALNKEMRNIEKKLSRLFDAWENEDISNNEFAQRKSVHNTRLENIKNEIEKLEEAVPEKIEYEERIVKLSDALNSMLDGDIEVKIKNQYLKAIIRRIEFSRENDEEFILDVDLI